MIEQSVVGEWADATFPRSTPATILAHLRREVGELSAAPADGDEAADCVLLLLHLAHKTGFDLAERVNRKFLANTRRTWGEPDAAGVVEHVGDDGEGGGG